MRKEDGSKSSDIWLLGDSNPKNWEGILEVPLDPRHPARHNIWTPVLEVMQDFVFRACRSRIDTSTFYVRNAIESPRNKPLDTSVDWHPTLEREVQAFGAALTEHRPKLLLSFGAFAFEFARRALDPSALRHPYGYWGAKSLGEEFLPRVSTFSPDNINLLPLLHVTIARGRFIESHTYFCQNTAGANYFTFVGNRIAQKLVENHDQLRIWIA